MSNHNQILNSFNSILNNFDFKNSDHRIQLMKILMKTSDISNECRPVNVSELWLDCLLEEFFNQVKYLIKISFKLNLLIKQYLRGITKS